jgi:hypothetical protein
MARLDGSIISLPKERCCEWLARAESHESLAAGAASF